MSARWALPVATVAALSLLAACGGSSTGTASSSGGTLNVVASTNVWGGIAQQIGGDNVTVTSFISDPNQDPHSYEANTRNQLAIKNAQLVIENGGGYDDFMDTLVKAAGSPNTVINAVDISGKKATAGDELNEHVWYDFPTAIKVAGVIESKLSAADPSKAETFKANLATFTQKVQGMQGLEAKIKAAHHGAGVAITEPVPVYLLGASGLVNKTPAAFSEAIEEGNDVPVAVLNDALKLFSDKQVAALVYNEQTTGPITEKVKSAAAAASIPVVPVTETMPPGSTYVDWMTKQLNALSVALGK